jgi:hypothetical protein
MPSATEGIYRRKYGTGHSYKIDGVKVPGVTTITGYYRAKDSPLAGYPAKQTREYAINNWGALSELPPAERINALYSAQYAERNEAAVRGTDVHRIAARLHEAGPDDEIEVPEELAGHVEAYGDFLERVQPRVQAVELVVANRTVRYCGALDLIADLGPVRWDGTIIPPSRWLLDLKTARSGIWPETALQLCGYEHAEVFVAEDGTERPMGWFDPPIQRCGAIHVRGDGWDLVPLDTGPETWTTFQYLAWLYHHEEARKEWVGAAAGPFPLPAAIPA